jgi:hypothetical protein
MLRPRGTCHGTAPTLPSPNGGRVLLTAPDCPTGGRSLFSATFAAVARAVAVLVVATALLLGCGGGSRAGASPAAAASGQGSYAVVVRDGGRTVGRFDLAALRAMPQADISTPKSQGKQTQHGPRVRTVLARAGVQRFGRLKVAGPGGTGAFSSAEIDDQVVLDFDNRGTVKLAGANLTVDRWVRDVTELDASP